MPDLAARLARVRVPLGFVSSLAALVARAADVEVAGAGLLISAAGEAIRVWAAGHLEKGREVTKSGPTGSPGTRCISGSTLIGVGFAVAANSLAVARHRGAVPRADARRGDQERRGGAAREVRRANTWTTGRDG